MMILTAIGSSTFFFDDTSSPYGFQAKIKLVSASRIRYEESRGRANQCKLKK
jgi:hypothetical protein